MSQEIFDHVDDNLGIMDEEGPSIDPQLAKKIENAFFDICRENAKLQKIMRDQKHPSYRNNLKPPKIKAGNSVSSEQHFLCNEQ